MANDPFAKGQLVRNAIGLTAINAILTTVLFYAGFFVLFLGSSVTNGCDPSDKGSGLVLALWLGLCVVGALVPVVVLLRKRRWQPVLRSAIVVAGSIVLGHLSCYILLAQVCS